MKVAESLELLSMLVGVGNFNDKQLRRNMVHWLDIPTVVSPVKKRLVPSGEVIW